MSFDWLLTPELANIPRQRRLRALRGWRDLPWRRCHGIFALAGMSNQSKDMLGFQTLDVYVAAKELVARVVKAKIDDKELRDQATRAAKSVLLRMAEGLPHRQQPMRRKYFAESNGSVYELVAAVDVAGTMGVMRDEDVRTIVALAVRVTQMLCRLMR